MGTLHHNLFITPQNYQWLCVFSLCVHLYTEQGNDKRLFERGGLQGASNEVTVAFLFSFFPP